MRRYFAPKWFCASVIFATRGGSGSELTSCVTSPLGIWPRRIQYRSTIEITQATWDDAIMLKAIRQYLKQIGQRGGSVTSPEKARAARRNGKLGGRPRKVKR